MSYNLAQLLAEKNAMIEKGHFAGANEKFYADNTRTVDFTGLNTNGKADHTQKMKDFLGSIAKVNKVTFHRSGVGDGVTFAEFTFDFDMRDGSKILWHEIIMSVWENGLVVFEQYFLA
jgi:hypothetical protein